MSFNTEYNDHYIIIAETPDAAIMGTAELGDEFGEVRNARLRRVGNGQEIENSVGGLRAYLLKNPRFELELEIIFDGGKAYPGLGEKIDFPLAGLTGFVLSAEFSWASGQQKAYKLTANSWDSLADASSFAVNSAGTSTIISA